MKKFIIAALAASVLASPVLAQPGFGHADRDRVEESRHTTIVKTTVVRHDDRRPEYRRWAKGQRFDRHYARNYRVIGSPRAYHLQPAPRGYHWVQSGNDAVLIGITSGIVASVLANALH